MEPFGKRRAKHYHPIEYAGSPYFQIFHPFGYIGKCRAQPSHPIEYAGNPSFQTSHPIGYTGKRRAQTFPPIGNAGNPSFQTFHRLDISANAASDYPIRFGVLAMGEKLPQRGYTLDSPGLPTIGGYPG